MSTFMRILLAGIGIVIFVYFMVNIRKKRIHIEYAMYWGCFSALLVLVCIFPELLSFLARILGVELPVHLMLLGACLIIVLKLFSDTLKISSLERKIVDLTQKIALLETSKEQDIQEKRDEEKDE